MIVIVVGFILTTDQYQWLHIARAALTVVALVIVAGSRRLGHELERLDRRRRRRNT